MRNASSSLGAIAAALAQAQAELVNPEKSLVGALPALRPGVAPRRFRYAPLSSGLEIARSTLARHSLALIQTTSIDAESKCLRLQSALLHTSGEWIASDWPVCDLADIVEPHRMGAAMTYARRYALFALIGIVGEDDLDAPDLDVALETPRRDRVAGNGALCATVPAPPQEKPNVRTREEQVSARGPDSSEADMDALHIRLVDEIEGISDEDAAGRWVQARFAEKRRLPPQLARDVEARFVERLAQLAPDSEFVRTPRILRLSPSVLRDDVEKDVKTASPNAKAAISGDAAPEWKYKAKPEQALVSPPSIPLRLAGPVSPKTLRVRDKDHLKFVASRPCLVCGRAPADPHHLRYVQPRAMARKASDEFVVPLCRLHHDEAHRHGDEARWWEGLRIDPVSVALALWRRTRSEQTHRAPERREAAGRSSTHDTGGKDET